MLSGENLLWCRAEKRTRACLTSSRRAANWATPHHFHIWGIFFLTMHTLVLIGESIHIFLNKCNQTLLKGGIFISTIVRVKSIGALTRAGLKTSYAYTNICVICNCGVHLFYEKKLVFSGPSTLIEVNMQVRSMGPISEMDMVSINVTHI